MTEDEMTGEELTEDSTRRIYTAMGIRFPKRGGRNESCERSVKPHYGHCNFLGSDASYDICKSCEFYSPRRQE